MKRRTFYKLTAKGIAISALAPSLSLHAEPNPSVRLGGPIFRKYESPEEWVEAVKQKNFRTAYCPVKVGASGEEIRKYEEAAKKADILIAEVGIWKNMLSVRDQEAKEAYDLSVDSLALADEIGANCCVNISGSKNPEHWAGPHEDNLTKETFEEIVELSKKLLKEVNPKRTFFVLEPMPWAYPDSPDSYLDLIKAIDHPQFGVHFDPVNILSSPQLLYNNGAFIKECFKKLAPHIKSCHAKDIVILSGTDLPKFEEIRPGLGLLDYQVFLKELSKLEDIPLLMEHLSGEEEYDKASGYIRSEANKAGVAV
ncbi:sugar phosphate isomerase/epimerase family protein [Pleomorphovibrio marinus]|uniref:sugar phosphate isomerase/epimerase family protein n=1 Tax=Pleomorphovibrio marinus TaxID=2164132 RepID=UPI0018E51674|nr:sugar phosphate isomerase/epimerase [Pleomorphovibrio marinus]